MSQDTLTILLNEEVIAIDQDPLGKQGNRIRQEGGKEVWMRELADHNTRAVVLFNTNDHPTLISVTWKEVGMKTNGKAKVRDLWLHKDLGTFRNFFSSTVPAHGVVMFTATEV